MIGVIGVIAMLTVLFLSLIITRLATVALVLTGLSQEAARFQARSAFTGTGFTTREAESIVDHPVRRRIVMVLMILRSAGLISIIISLILSFVGSDTDQVKLTRLAYLACGVFVIWLLSQSRWIDRAMRKAMEHLLRRWSDLDTRDYVSLLNLSGPYTVREEAIDEDHWLASRGLGDCKLHKEGVLVLGIYRNDGSYIGAPTGNTEIEPGDTLVLYGRAESLRELGERQAGAEGEQAHANAVEQQEREEAREEGKDRQNKPDRVRKRQREREEADPGRADHGGEHD